MDELKAFRNNIGNYNYNKKKIKKLKEQIEDKFYSYFGVKGIDPSKFYLENKNNKAFESIKLNNIEKFDRYKKQKLEEIKLLKKQNEYIDRLLNKMDDLTKNVFISIYIEESSYIDTCHKLNIIDEKGNPKIGELQYIMKKAFKED